MTYQRFPQSNTSNTNYGGSQLYTETEAVGEPSEEDIEEFARRIGLDTKTERHLLYLARDGLLAKLPPDWKPVRDAHRDAWYYYNTQTHLSQWEHPMDVIYRDKVIQARSDHAMNRIQNFDVNTPKPLKSLPPLKKGGGGINSFPSPSTLSKLGPLKHSSFSSSEDLSGFSTSLQKTNPSSSLQHLEPLIKKPPLTLNPISGSHTSQSNGNHNYEQEISNPRNPNTTRIRMDTNNTNNNSSSNNNSNSSNNNTMPLAPLKKSGLTLTGTGASFLKSAKTTSSSTDLNVEKKEDVIHPSQPNSMLKPTPNNNNNNSNSTTNLNKIESNTKNKMIPDEEEQDDEDDDDNEYVEDEEEEESNLFQPQKPDETTSMTTNHEASLSERSTSTGRPLKSILVQKNSLKSRSRLDEISTTTTTPTKRNLWDIDTSALTAEESNQWDSLNFKRKPSVKFQLEDPKITFDVSSRETDDQETTEDEDSEEELDEESDHKSDDMKKMSAITSSQNNIMGDLKPKLSPPMEKPMSAGDGKFVVQQATHEQEHKVQNMSEIGSAPITKSVIQSTDKVLDRQTIKMNMEKEIKEYQAKMEEEGQRKQEQIKANIEQTVSHLKSEMESVILKTKGEFEVNKKKEIEKARVEMETTLMTDLEKIRIEYKEKLNKQKQELAAVHEAAMKAETEQLNSTKDNSAKLAAAGLEFEKKLAEEINQLKAQMTEQHNKQIDEMKAHHKATIQQLRKEFQAEEEKVKKDQSDMIVELLSKFDSEKQSLIRSFEVEQDKIKQEFSVKAAQLTEELNQTLESIKKQFEEKSKQITMAGNSPSQASNSASARGKLSSAESLSHSKQTNNAKQAEEELVQLKQKYKTLEEKYTNLKRGIHNVVVNEKAKMSEKNYDLFQQTHHQQQQQHQSQHTNIEALDLESRFQHPQSQDIQLEDINNTNTNNTVDSGAGAESEDTSATSVSSFGQCNKNSDNDKQNSENDTIDPEDNDKTIHKIMSGSNDRLNLALMALDDLKKQILDIRAEQRKIVQVEFNSEDVHVIHPRKEREKHSKESLRSNNNNNNNVNSARTVTSSSRVPRAHVSRSALDTNSLIMPTAHKSPSKNNNNNNNPNNNNNSGLGSHHRQLSSSLKDISGRNYVDEAKDFIKSQKYRLKRPGLLSFGAPVSTSIGAKQRLNPNTNNGETTQPLPMTSSSIQHQLMARSKSHQHSLDHYSETESSGVGSWKETKSEEKSKIGQDIEGILTSLQQLDGQMKYLWSVVGGGAGAGTATGNNNATNIQSQTPLITSAQLLQPPILHPPSSTQLLKGKSNPNPNPNINMNPIQIPHSQNVKHFAQSFKEPINITELALKYNLAPNLITPGNQALINSINVVNSAQFRRSFQDITSNPVVTTLEEHVNNIRNRQNRIIREYPTEKRDRSPSISEKTKDLREWLEKF